MIAKTYHRIGILVFAAPYIISCGKNDYKTPLEFPLPIVSTPSEIFQTNNQEAIERRIINIESNITQVYSVKGKPIQKTALANRMNELKVPGVSIAVFSNGELEWAKCYGWADYNFEKHVDTETMFQAASISKSPSTIAMLKLVEHGELNLDVDVEDYLTSWQIPDNPFTVTNKVTLRRIVSHTAGLTIHGAYAYAHGEKLPSIIDYLDGNSMEWPTVVFQEPGKSMSYSGGGFMIMQLMFEDHFKQPFADFIDEIILTPLDMSRSTYHQPLPDHYAKNAAAGHGLDGKKVNGNWSKYRNQAAAGLWTTPKDLAKMAIDVQKSYASASGKILSKPMAQQSLTYGLGDYGLGFEISEDKLRFGHGGSNNGYKCKLSSSIKTGSGAAIMTNSENGLILLKEILLTIGLEYGWEGFTVEEKTVVELSDSEYELLVGDYSAPDTMGDIEVTYFDGKLWANANFLKKPDVLLPLSNTEFFNRQTITPVKFIFDNETVISMMVDIYNVPKIN